METVHDPFPCLSPAIPMGSSEKELMKSPEEEKLNALRNINLPRTNISEPSMAPTEDKSFAAAVGGKTRKLSTERNELVKYKEMLVKDGREKVIGEGKKEYRV